MNAAFAIGLGLGLVGVVAAQERAIGRLRVGTNAWSDVYSSNRSAEGVCSFTAIQVVKTLDQSTPQLAQGVSERDLDPVEIEVRDQKKGITFVYQLEGVTYTTPRTVEGGKERVTLRYKKCSIKERRTAD